MDARSERVDARLKKVDAQLEQATAHLKQASARSAKNINTSSGVRESQWRNIRRSLNIIHRMSALVHNVSPLRRSANKLHLSRRPQAKLWVVSTNKQQIRTLLQASNNALAFSKEGAATNRTPYAGGIYYAKRNAESTIASSSAIFLKHKVLYSLTAVRLPAALIMFEITDMLFQRAEASLIYI